MNLFRSKTKSSELVETENVQVVKQSLKTTKELIEEIHETFYTEVDRLLEEAKILKSTYSDKRELLDKAKRLSNLGFISSKDVQKSSIEEARISEIELENKRKQDLKEAIEYFSIKYPMYKFITKSSVKKICEKYGLVYGTVDNYIGTVPNKNIEQIEKFKIDEEDCSYSLTYYYSFGYDYINNISYKESLKFKDRRIMSIGEVRDCKKSLLEIAAPISDFNIKNMKIEDFNVVQDLKIPDPVVLQPVIFRNKKYYLIVTAWGDEASDELVVNQNMN